MTQTMKIEIIHEDKVLYDLNVPKNHICDFLDWFQEDTDEQFLRRLIDCYLDEDPVIDILKNYDEIHLRTTLISCPINPEDTINSFLIYDYKDAIDQVTRDLKDKYGLQNDQINSLIKKLKETL